MTPGWTKQYPTVGQGVMSFNTTQNNPFAIVVTDNRSEDWISLDVHKNCAFFTICISGEKVNVFLRSQKSLQAIENNWQ